MPAGFDRGMDRRNLSGSRSHAQASALPHPEQLDPEEIFPRAAVFRTAPVGKNEACNKTSPPQFERNTQSAVCFLTRRVAFERVKMAIH